jgi:hypothetical protein
VMSDEKEVMSDEKLFEDSFFFAPEARSRR